MTSVTRTHIINETNILNDVSSIKDKLVNTTVIDNANIMFPVKNEPVVTERLKYVCGSEIISLIESINTHYNSAKGKVYIAGGIINLALDTSLDICNSIYDRSDIDIFVISKSPYYKTYVLNTIIAKLNNADSTYIGTRGSVVYIWSTICTRMIQIIFMDDKYNGGFDLILNFDLTHVMCAFDGLHYYATDGAIKAFVTKNTYFTVSASADNDYMSMRILKSVLRGYTVFVRRDDGTVTKYNFDIMKDIVCSNKSFKYLCSEYINHTAVLERFKNNQEDIIKYYLNLSTASKLYLYTYAQKYKIYRGINIRGINNRGNTASKDGTFNIYVGPPIRPITNFSHRNGFHNRGPVAGASDPKPVAGASDPKPVAGASDPKPVAKSYKQPVAVASDPKPVAGASNPKSVAGASDPKPVAGASDPKPVAGASDPKSGAKIYKLLTKHVFSDPKPVTSDPKPVTSDPKPVTSDPKPIASDPKPVTVTSDPKPVISMEKFAEELPASSSSSSTDDEDNGFTLVNKTTSVKKHMYVIGGKNNVEPTDATTFKLPETEWAYNSYMRVISVVVPYEVYMELNKIRHTKTKSIDIIGRRCKCDCKQYILEIHDVQGLLQNTNFLALYFKLMSVKLNNYGIVTLQIDTDMYSELKSNATPFMVQQLTPHYNEKRILHISLDISPKLFGHLWSPEMLTLDDKYKTITTNGVLLTLTRNTYKFSNNIVITHELTKNEYENLLYIKQCMYIEIAKNGYNYKDYIDETKSKFYKKGDQTMCNIIDFKSVDTGKMYKTIQLTINNYKQNLNIIANKSYHVICANSGVAEIVKLY